MKKNKILIMVLCIAMICSMASMLNGCAKKTNAGVKGTKLVLWMPGAVPATPADETDAYKKQMALFKQIKTATGIDIEYDLIPFADYDNKCNAALSAQTGPDILQVNSVTVASFISQGYLKTTDALMNNSTIKQSDFYPGLWKHVLYKGKQYGLPIDTGTRALIYNKDMLTSKGITFGDETTWDQLNSAVAACTHKTATGVTDVFGYGFVGGEPWGNLYQGVGLFALQDGAKFLSDDLTKAQFDSPEVESAVNLFANWYKAGYVPKDCSTIADQNQINDMFVSGKVAMETGGHWDLDYILSKNPSFKVGVTLTKNTQIASSTGGWVLSIAKKNKNDAAAWKLFEYIFQPENLVQFTSIMPATVDANKLTLQDSKYDLFKKVLPMSTHPIAINPQLPEIAKLLMDEQQSIYMGKETVDAGMKNLDKSVDALLANQ